MSDNGIHDTHYITYPQFIAVLAGLFTLSIIGVFTLVSPAISGLSGRVENLSHQIERSDDRVVREISEVRLRFEHEVKALHDRTDLLNTKLENGIRTKLDEAVEKMNSKFDLYGERFTAFQLQISTNRNRIKGVEEDPDGDGYRQKAPRAPLTPEDQ